MKKIFVFALISFLIIWGGSRVFYALTDGFLISRIQSHLPPDEKWNIRELSPEDKLTLNSILNQKFHYLDKGHQAYVFASADDKWVIKFLKFHRYRYNFFYNMLPLPQFLAKSRENSINHKTKKIEWIFESWKLSYEEMQEDTGFFFVHINPTNDLNLNITFIDKLGFETTHDADKLTFIIQKKVEVLGPLLKKLYLIKDYDQMKYILHQFIVLCVSELKKGFIETDNHPERNVGYINGKIIHLDPARFIKDEQIKDPYLWKDLLTTKMARLQSIIENNYPEVYNEFVNELKLAERLN